MPFSLLSADGQSKYDVRDGAPMLVGRAPTCDVPVFDPTVSRRHSELSLVAGGVKVVDLGSANGTVEAVGLRITTVRDGNGTVWYVRNGEILRVGNKSQGYAVAVADLPLAHTADLAQAAEIAARVATEVAEDPRVAEHLLDQPEVVGIEKVGPEGVTFRVQARTTPGQQFGVQRVLITALAEGFDRAGLPRPLSFPTAPPPPTK